MSQQPVFLLPSTPSTPRSNGSSIGTVNSVGTMPSPRLLTPGSTTPRQQRRSNPRRPLGPSSTSIWTLRKSQSMRSLPSSNSANVNKFESYHQRYKPTKPSVSKYDTDDNEQPNSKFSSDLFTTIHTASSTDHNRNFRSNNYTTLPNPTSPNNFGDKSNFPQSPTFNNLRNSPGSTISRTRSGIGLSRHTEISLQHSIDFSHLFKKQNQHSRHPLTHQVLSSTDSQSINKPTTTVPSELTSSDSFYSPSSNSSEHQYTDSDYYSPLPHMSSPDTYHHHHKRPYSTFESTENDLFTRMFGYNSPKRLVIREPRYHDHDNNNKHELLADKFSSVSSPHKIANPYKRPKFEMAEQGIKDIDKNASTIKENKKIQLDKHNGFFDVSMEDSSEGTNVDENKENKSVTKQTSDLNNSISTQARPSYLGSPFGEYIKPAKNPIFKHNTSYQHSAHFGKRPKQEEEDIEQKRKELIDQRRKEKEEMERLERERLERERLERERLECERLERERLERERLERERLERERLEREMLEKEMLEQERLEKERLEKERLEKERLEKERLEEENRLRIEIEHREAEKKEKLEKERQEREKQQQQQIEKEKPEKEEGKGDKAEQLKSKNEASKDSSDTNKAKGDNTSDSRPDASSTAEKDTKSESSTQPANTEALVPISVIFNSGKDSGNSLVPSNKDSNILDTKTPNTTLESSDANTNLSSANNGDMFSFTKTLIIGKKDSNTEMTNSSDVKRSTYASSFGNKGAQGFGFNSYNMTDSSMGNNTGFGSSSKNGATALSGNGVFGGTINSTIGFGNNNPNANSTQTFNSNQTFGQTQNLSQIPIQKPATNTASFKFSSSPSFNFSQQSSTVSNNGINSTVISPQIKFSNISKPVFSNTPNFNNPGNNSNPSGGFNNFGNSMNNNTNIPAISGQQQQQQQNNGLNQNSSITNGGFGGFNNNWNFNGNNMNMNNNNMNMNNNSNNQQFFSPGGMFSYKPSSLPGSAATSAQSSQNGGGRKVIPLRRRMGRPR